MNFQVSWELDRKLSLLSCGRNQCKVMMKDNEDGLTVAYPTIMDGYYLKDLHAKQIPTKEKKLSQYQFSLCPKHSSTRFG